MRRARACSGASRGRRRRAVAAAASHRVAPLPSSFEWPRSYTWIDGGVGYTHGQYTSWQCEPGNGVSRAWAWAAGAAAAAAAVRRCALRARWSHPPTYPPTLACPPSAILKAHTRLCSSTRMCFPTARVGDIRAGGDVGFERHRRRQPLLPPAAAPCGRPPALASPARCLLHLSPPPFTARKRQWTAPTRPASLGSPAWRAAGSSGRLLTRAAPPSTTARCSTSSCERGPHALLHALLPCCRAAAPAPASQAPHALRQAPHAGTVGGTSARLRRAPQPRRLPPPCTDERRTAATYALQLPRKRHGDQPLRRARPGRLAA